MKFELGQIVQTKKVHPCGGDRWEVVRTGADYKIRCLTCGRVVLLTPEKLESALKRTQKKETHAGE